MKQLVLLVIAIVFSSCKDGKKLKNRASQESSSKEEVVNVTPEAAKKMLETQCYLCHNPSAEEENLIAPPMAAIKAGYMKNSTKEEFIDAIWAFVEKPSKEKAKLKGAIDKFGVMPYQPYSEEDIKGIAAFMFDYQIEEPTWFKKHWEEKHGEINYKQSGTIFNTAQSTSKSYKDIGMRIALSTKKQLGKNLMGTIQKKGTLAALKFCNIKAYPLTDSMATVHNARIKRVSDKPRNKNNQANEKELALIAYFKNAVASGEAYQPIVEKENGMVSFYAPITTNTMCLQCHGKPETDIKPEVLASLKNLYPDDRAKGYGANEVRGIWSIDFKEE